MPYEFPIDIRDRLQARLQEGLYQSEDDVIRHAMDALDQVEYDKLTRWTERNRLASEQSEQRVSQPLDDDKVLSRLRERLADEGILG
jgi:Arc/MetJ-type ribon-helix-helix transcriptional regulator